MIDATKESLGRWLPDRRHVTLVGRLPIVLGAESELRVPNAGWHADPTGRHGLRYHDAARWTEHVADAGIQGFDPLTPSLPAPPLAASAGPWAVTRWGFPVAREHPNGTIILVFGVPGLVVCGLLGPVAWVMGSRAVSEMKRQPTTVWTNRGQVRAGQICGIISSCLLAITVGILILLFATGAFDDFGEFDSSCQGTVSRAKIASISYWTAHDTWPSRFSDLTDDGYLTLRAGTRETADSTSITNGEWIITIRGGGLRETTFDTVGC